MEAKAIIFDLGSVCFDIDWEVIDQKMKEKFGISSLIRSGYGADVNAVYDRAQRGEAGLREVFGMICKARDLDAGEVTNYYKELYKKYKNPNEKVLELIKNLKGKVKTACLSNTNEVHFQAHEEQGHLTYFDSTFGSFQIGKIKENAGAFDKVLERLNVKPAEAILIDDDDKNIANAKANGLLGIKYENYDQLVGELNKFGIGI